MPTTTNARKAFTFLRLHARDYTEPKWEPSADNIGNRPSDEIDAVCFRKVDGENDIVEVEPDLMELAGIHLSDELYARYALFVKKPTTTENSKKEIRTSWIDGDQSAYLSPNQLSYSRAQKIPNIPIIAFDIIPPYDDTPTFPPIASINHPVQNHTHIILSCANIRMREQFYRLSSSQPKRHQRMHYVAFFSK
jgi:hypothetical protein